MEKFKLLPVFFIFFLIFNQALGQSGTIRGQVIEDETGEGLIGATVVIAGTTTGASTDLDGKFNINNVTPGTYNIQISYVSYETKSVSNVEVKPGEVTVLNNIRLGEASIGLETVVVEVDILKDTESALLTVQKKAPTVLDGISAESFGRTGDNDAGEAMRRVTGVSVEGGRYVYVRGLGDRYSKTSLNGADIPGLDPNKNSVQMDLFPTNLIDNIIVYKTFSPDLPGNFSGGYIDIATKDFPEAFTLNFATSFGFNPQANLNKSFLTYQGGKLDWLGFDDGTRDFPDGLRNVPPPVGQEDNLIPSYGEALSNPDKGARLTEITKSFNSTVSPIQKSQFLNHNHSLSLGTQTNLFGKPFGFIANVSYRRDFQSYEGGATGRYKLLDSAGSTLNNELKLEDNASSMDVLWGAMVSGSVKLSPQHKIGLNILRNQSAQSKARYQEGTKPTDDPDLFYQTRTLLFQQRALTSYQLKGEHALGQLKGPKIDWIASYTNSTMKEPDLRFFTNGFRVFEGDTVYSIEPSIGQLPTRYRRSMEEYNFNSKLNITIPFKQWSGLETKFKFGGAYVLKEREFRETQYGYANQTNQFDGDPINYVSDGNIWDFHNNGSTKGVYILNDYYQKRNNYDGRESVAGGYAMIDIPITKKFRAITGARVEKTDIYVSSQDTSLNAGVIDNLDVLPSLNLTYELIENMNLRAAYNRTLARPVFRELAPFGSFDFIGDFILVGSDSLERTLIDNFDLRWEYFFERGEIISISGFYKNFQNPIERVDNPVAVNAELNFRNVDQARVFGVEVELRKNLGFISSALQNFSIGSNFTYVKSVVDIAQDELLLIRATDPNAKPTREMFGQSPYVVNAYLSYINNKGTRANVNFNVQGKRLAVVIRGGTPDVFEAPRPTLDVNISQQFGKWTLKASATNLINPAHKYTYLYNDREYLFQSARYGRNFSLGVSFLIE